MCRFGVYSYFICRHRDEHRHSWREDANSEPSTNRSHRDLYRSDSGT